MNIEQLKRDNASLMETNRSLLEQNDALRTAIAECREINRNANAMIGDVAEECKLTVDAALKVTTRETVRYLKKYPEYAMPVL